MSKKLARNVLAVGLALSSVFNANAVPTITTVAEHHNSAPLFMETASAQRNARYLYNGNNAQIPDVIAPNGFAMFDSEGNMLKEGDDPLKAKSFRFEYNADRFESNKRYMFSNDFRALDIDMHLVIKGSLNNCILVTKDTFVTVENLDGQSYIYSINDTTNDNIDKVDDRYSNTASITIGRMDKRAAITASKGTIVRIEDDWHVLEEDRAKPYNEADRSNTVRHSGLGYALYSN